MTGDAILQPMLAMMVLTALVWFWLYAVRIPAMRTANRPVQSYTTPETGTLQLPEEANYPSNNFKNLFELPVIFYALCLYLYATGSAAQVDVFAAWAFFLFRALHSVIHCTVNIVMARFATYALAALVLWLMLGRAILNAWF
ncbi:MAG: MAPEG family protein [Gammaproteobacteria bacterium]|nr:MAPEG family protein [Gammaproteobacteria bacterium]